MRQTKNPFVGLLKIYGLIFIALYFIIAITSIIQSIELGKKYSAPEGAYCSAGDSEYPCTVGQAIVGAFSFVPFVFFIFSIFYVVFPQYTFHALSQGDLLLVFVVLIYVSIPFVFYFVNKKYSGRYKKAIKIIILCVIGLFVANMIFQTVSFYRPYHILTKIEREPCSYFSPKEYLFNNITIRISEETCKNDKKIQLFFKMSIDTKRYDIIDWSLCDFRINDQKADIRQDSFIDESPCRVYAFNKTKTFDLYLNLPDATLPDSLVITNAGFNVRTLREWNWENSTIRDQRNARGEY